MKSLKNLAAVEIALKKIAERSSIQFDNGTYGETVKAYLWNVEEQRSQEYDELMKKIVRKKFAQQDYSEELKQLHELPAAKVMLVFRLIDAMNLTGTKIMPFNGKNISPKIENCKEIFIPQEILEADLVQYKEVGKQKMINMEGQEVPVVELNLGRCLIDVKEGTRDRFNAMKWLRAPRAYVTDIPFRSFQVVSNALRREDYQRYKAYGMMDDADVEQAMAN